MARAILNAHNVIANSPQTRHRSEWVALQAVRSQEQQIEKAQRRLEELRQVAGKAS